jgi:hypothetical protein
MFNKKGDNTTTLWIVGGLVLVLIVIAILIYSYTKTSNSSSDVLANLGVSELASAVAGCRTSAIDSAFCASFKSLSSDDKVWYTCDNTVIRKDLGMDEKKVQCEDLKPYNDTLVAECNEKIKKFPAVIFASGKTINVTSEGGCASISAQLV